MKFPVFLFLVSVFALSATASRAADSQCFGTVSKGRIENSVSLPASGPNFAAYSRLAGMLGRTHVHSTVAGIVKAAYLALQTETPGVSYVYGETGWPSGGRFRPHRSHQNGLSVDFFVPVRNAAGVSVPLPTGIMSRWGYDIEFNARAQYEEYSIDFAAMAEHLYQLQVAARSRGVGVAMVIFDQAYLARLFDTPRGAYLQKNLTFMKGQPWVRHDEHYHVDFAVPCQADKP